MGNQQLAGHITFLPLRHTNRKREGEGEKDPLEGAKAGLSDVNQPALFGQALLSPHPPAPPSLSLHGPYRNSPPRHIILRKPLATPHSTTEPQLIGRKRRLVTACVDTGVCVHLLFFLKIPFVPEQRELLSVCSMYNQLVRSEHFVL